MENTSNIVAGQGSYNYGCQGHPEETSNPLGRKFQTFHGSNLLRMTPLYVLGRHQAGSRGVPARIEVSIQQALAHCSLPPRKVADFKPLWVVAMFSVLSPCWQKPLGARDHSLVTLQPASLFLLWGKGGKEEKLVIVTSRLLPPKMLLPKGCPSGGGCWGGVALSSVRRTSHTDAVETGLGGSSYLWNAYGKCKHWAASRALSRLFYLWITLSSPESVWVHVREININVAVVILISPFVLILSILWK